MKFKIVLTTILFFVIASPGLAHAFFSETEISNANTFSAATLKTQMDVEFPLPIVKDLTTGEDFTFSFKLYNLGTLETTNNLSVFNITNEKFASEIFVVVVLDEVQTIYKGYLNNLNIQEYLQQIPSSANAVSFTFSIFEDSGESVSFGIKNHAWQIELPYGSGFHDSEYISVTLNSRKTEERVEVVNMVLFELEEETQVKEEPKEVVETFETEVETKVEPENEKEEEIRNEPPIELEEEKTEGEKIVAEINADEEMEEEYNVEENIDDG